MGLKYSWLITGGPKRQPGTEDSRGAEATVVSGRTVGASWGGMGGMGGCGYPVGVGRRALSAGGTVPFLSPHQFLKGCYFYQTVCKGRAFSVIGGDP